MFFNLFAAVFCLGSAWMTRETVPFLSVINGAFGIANLAMFLIGLGR